jgi:hypothetical protein
MRALEKPKPITTKFDRTFALENPRPRDQSKIDHNLQWYAKHSSPDRKGGVKHRESEKIRYRNIHKHLVTGVLSEDAEKEVTDNIMFASPLHTKEPERRGGISKKIALSHKFQGAVKTLKEYDTNDRWGSGLNANTLMTEYRRKVLFHALLDSGDVDESREHAQEKVRRFITVNFPQEMTEEDKLDEAREREMEAEKNKSAPSSSSSSSATARSRSKSSTKRGTVHETNFSPKYVFCYVVVLITFLVCDDCLCLSLIRLLLPACIH